MLTAAEKLRREGRREGKAEGKREMLLLQLRQRFGRLPAGAVARIGAATIEQLDAWSGQVLAAASLDDVLGATVAEPPSEAAPPNRARPRGARRRASG